MGIVKTIAKLIVISISVSYLVLHASYYGSPFFPLLCNMTGKFGCPEIYIDGFIMPEWSPVRDAFHENFSAGDEAAGQLAIWYKGEFVVDLYGRLQEPNLENTRDPSLYDAKSMQLMFSSTKTVAAILMAKLMQEEKSFTYHDKISKHWPEFAQNGKQDITIAQLLRHEAGLDSLGEMTTYDLLHPFENDSMKKRIEKTTPWWSSKTKRVYHGLTRGEVLNELFRILHPKNLTMGQYLAEIRDEYNIRSGIYIGGIPEDELKKHVKPLQRWSIWATLAKIVVPFLSGFHDLIHPDTLAMMKMLDSSEEENARWMKTLVYADTGETVFGHSDGGMKFYDTDDYYQSEVPSANGVGSARGVATFLSMVAHGSLNGKPFMSQETYDAFTYLDPEEATKLDAGCNFITTFSDGGVCHNTLNHFNDTDHFFGWVGYGGSMVQVNRHADLAFAYIPNSMHVYFAQDPRHIRLTKAIQAVLKKKQKQEKK